MSSGEVPIAVATTDANETSIVLTDAYLYVRLAMTTLAVTNAYTSLNGRIYIPIAVAIESDEKLRRHSIGLAVVNKCNRKLYRRKLLPYTVHQIDEVQFRVSFETYYDDTIYEVGIFPTEQEARSAAFANCPPVWVPRDQCPTCAICFISFSFMRKGKHCRNCGALVCEACSMPRVWHRSGLPSLYHFDAPYVRICDCCQDLTMRFAHALRRGDLHMCSLLHATGNVNLRCPFTMLRSKEFPIHAAAASGHLELLRWLVETHHCPLVVDGEPLRDAEGRCVFTIAATLGCVDIMQFLTVSCGCSVDDITEPAALRKGLRAMLSLEDDGAEHAALDIGDNYRARKQLPSLPRAHAEWRTGSRTMPETAYPPLELAREPHDNHHAVHLCQNAIYEILCENSPHRCETIICDKWKYRQLRALWTPIPVPYCDEDAQSIDEAGFIEVL